MKKIFLSSSFAHVKSLFPDFINEGSKTHVQAILFRDSLRIDAKLCRKYERIKNGAIKNTGTEPKAYNDFKSNFIRDVIELHNQKQNSDG